MARLLDISLGSDAALEGYWQFDNAATDASGNGNDLTLLASPSYSTTAKYGSHSIDLELGSAQGAYRADSASLSITGSQTASMWVNFESLPGDFISYGLMCKWQNSGVASRSYAFLVRKPDTDPDDYQLWTMYSTDGSYQAANDKVVNWSPAPTTGVWYHLARVIDTSVPEIRYYVNGVQMGADQSTTGSSVFDGTLEFSIGIHVNNADTDTWANPFDGKVDDCAIFSRALTDAEILSIYEDTSPIMDLTSKRW